MKTDIITFSDQLLEKLKADSVFEESNDFNVTGKSLSKVRQALTELRKFVVTYRFISDAEEIQFFRESKPVLLSQYYYYHRKFSILLFDSFSDVQKRKVNYDKILQKMHRYALRHKDFYQYCVSSQNDNDHSFFIRNKSIDHLIEFDELFSTGYDMILSRLLAHELLREFILKQMHAMEYGTQTNSSLRWNDSKVAMIELIYALQASGAINTKGEIKPIITAFQQLFDIDLGNYARVFAEIRIRKNGQTTFLDRITESLLKRIDEFNA